MTGLAVEVSVDQRPSPWIKKHLSLRGGVDRYTKRHAECQTELGPPHPSEVAAKDRITLIDQIQNQAHDDSQLARGQ